VSRAAPPSSHSPQSLDPVRNHTVFTGNMADVDYSRRNKVPRPISENGKAKLEEFIDSIHYSARSVVLGLLRHFGYSDTSHRYSDNEFEYRHVQLPKAMLKAIPKEYFSDPSKYLLKLLWEEEWRGLGITQARYCDQFMNWT
jgi:cyclin-dependent kinase regulatory subunit CKS1